MEEVGACLGVTGSFFIVREEGYFLEFWFPHMLRWVSDPAAMRSVCGQAFVRFLSRHSLFSSMAMMDQALLL